MIGTKLVLFFFDNFPKHLIPNEALLLVLLKMTTKIVL